MTVMRSDSIPVSDMPREQRPSVAERFTQILDVFTSGPDRMFLEEITAATGLPRSTVFRLLTQLVDLHWVEHDSRGYGPGLRMQTMARPRDYSQLRAAAAGMLNDLQIGTGGVAHLTVLEGSSVYFLDRIGGRGQRGHPFPGRGPASGREHRQWKGTARRPRAGAGRRSHDGRAARPVPRRSVGTARPSEPGAPAAGPRVRARPLVPHVHQRGRRTGRRPRRRRGRDLGGVPRNGRTRPHRTDGLGRRTPHLADAHPPAAPVPPRGPAWRTEHVWVSRTRTRRRAGRRPARREFTFPACCSVDGTGHSSTRTNTPRASTVRSPRHSIQPSATVFRPSVSTIREYRSSGSSSGVRRR